MNYLAILLAAILNMVIGAAWYSPMLFGKQWSKELGMKMEDMKKVDPKKAYGLTFVGALVLAVVMSYIVSWTKITTATDAIALGFLAWVGFYVSSIASDYVFSKRSTTLFSINAGYYLVVFLLNALVVALWR